MIKKIFNKYQEIIVYLIFGVLTTIVNFILFFMFDKLFDSVSLVKYGYLFATAIAWFGSVLFAFITNKLFVFKAKESKLSKEIIRFYLVRILSLCIDLLLMYLLIDLVLLNEYISKIIVNIVIVVINYVFSKFIVFKKLGR